MVGQRSARRPRPRGARWAALGAGVLAAVLAACGSQLDPAEVAQTTAGGAALGADGSVVPGSGSDAAAGGDVPGATDPGSAGVDGGAAAGEGGDTGTSAGGSDGGSPEGSGENAPGGDGKAGSCDGFKNQTGITDDKIVIANAADISGPVPGIFESAQQATRAYVAYFNQSQDICGRKLEVMALDSRAEAGADQQAYARACEGAFAAVGSMSAFDYGGAGQAQSCGLPDIRSYSVSGDRTACTTCFAAYAVKPNLVPNAMPQYWNKQEPDAVKSVGMLYVNSGAAVENAKNFKAGWEKNGWTVKVFKSIDTGEFNYSTYVQELKDNDVKLVNYTGPYQFTVRLQQAMAQQNYKPEVFLQDATIHDERYTEQAGDMADGVYVYSQTALFDDFSVQEMELYRSWLAQVDPDATPNTYGVYAWSATRLFVEQALRLGGKLDRKSLIASLGGVRNWTGNGIHAPQQVGAETTANCARIIRFTGGKWVKVSPGEYLCGSLTDTGL